MLCLPRDAVSSEADLVHPDLHSCDFEDESFKCFPADIELEVATDRDVSRPERIHGARQHPIGSRRPPRRTGADVQLKRRLRAHA